MDSIERTTLTLHGKRPDRVPVDLHNFMVTARLMGVSSFSDYFHDGAAMAEGQIMAWRRFGHDVVLVENGTAALAEACGVEITYLPDSAPVATGPVLQRLDDVDDLTIPDPYTTPALAENLKATRLVVEALGKEAFIIGRADQGPFSLACELRGLDNFMMDLVLAEPARVHKLLDFCRQVCTRYALAQIEQGAHCTSIGESPSGPDLISPTQYLSFAQPHVKRMVDDLSAQGVLLAYHICGNVTPILPAMVGTGAAILEIDQKTHMAAAKDAARGQTTLLGPIDPSSVMALGTPDLVMEKCREAIEILGPDGGFILGPGCALPATTPDANIDAMLEAARVYGQY